MKTWNVVGLAACLILACTHPSMRAAEPDRTVPQALWDAVSARPDDAEAQRDLAIRLHGAGRVAEALPHFEKVVALAPNARHLLDLALAYASASRAQDAEKTYRRLLALAPNDAIALHNMGNLAFNRGDAKAAADWYRKALAAKPDYILAQKHLADTLKKLGRYEEAYHAYERVLNDLEPKTAAELEAFDDSLYEMALLDLEMGATQRAADMLAQLVEASPENAQAHYAYSRALTALGRLDEARREIETHQRLTSGEKPTSPMATGDAP
jgi:tetratricopeptide (TPR) repeat protein